MSSIYRLGHDLYKEMIAAPYIEWFKQIQCHRQISWSPVGETRKRFVGRYIVMIVGWVPIANCFVHLARKFFKATSDDQLHDALNNKQDTLACLYLKSGYTFSKCPDEMIVKILEGKFLTTKKYLRDEAQLSLFQSIKNFTALQNAMDSRKDTLLVCFLKAHRERNNMQSQAYEQLKSKLFSDQKRYRLHIDHKNILTHVNWALDGDCCFSLFHPSQAITPQEKMQIFVNSLTQDFTASRCTKIIAYILKETDLSQEEKTTFILQCLESTRQSEKIQEFIRANQYSGAPFIQAIDLLCSQKEWKNLQPFISQDEDDLILQKIVDCIYQNLINEFEKETDDLLQLMLQFPKNTMFNLFKKILEENKIGQIPYSVSESLIKNDARIVDYMCIRVINIDNENHDILKLMLQLPKNLANISAEQT